MGWFMAVAIYTYTYINTQVFIYPYRHSESSIVRLKSGLKIVERVKVRIHGWQVLHPSTQDSFAIICGDTHHSRLHNYNYVYRHPAHNQLDRKRRDYNRLKYNHIYIIEYGTSRLQTINYRKSYMNNMKISLTKNKFSPYEQLN